MAGLAAIIIILGVVVPTSTPPLAPTCSFPHLLRWFGCWFRLLDVDLASLPGSWFNFFWLPLFLRFVASFLLSRQFLGPLARCYLHFPCSALLLRASSCHWLFVGFSAPTVTSTGFLGPYPNFLSRVLAFLPWLAPSYVCVSVFLLLHCSSLHLVFFISGMVHSGEKDTLFYSSCFLTSTLIFASPPLSPGICIGPCCRSIGFSLTVLPSKLTALACAVSMVIHPGS